MKLTVIIPVFNTEEYLPACLASISAQTARGEMKLILVDDGSTDGSGKLCDDFAASDPDTRVLHTENGGVSRARNAALELVDTPYFGFCDSDDTLEPDYYERLLTAAEKVGADIAFCGMTFDRGEEKRPRPAFFPEGEIITGSDVGLSFAKKMLTDGSQNSTVNKVFKKRFIDAGIRFPEGIKIGEDKRFVLDCLSVADTLVCAGGCGYYYRDVQTSAMHSGSKMQKLLETYEDEINAFARLGLDESEVREGKSVFLFTELTDFLERAFLLSPSDAKREVKNSLADERLMSCVEPGLDRVMRENGRVYTTIAKGMKKRSAALIMLGLRAMALINRE